MATSSSMDSGSSRGWVVPFVATLFAMMTLQMSSLGFSPLLPDIQKAFSINYSQLGLFTGLYGIIALIMSLPAGMMAKRFGEKRMLALGLLIVALGLFLLSRAPSYAAALTYRGVWLVGYRFAFVCVMTAMALTCPTSLRGASMGILGAMSSVATLVGAPFGSMLGQAFGWRQGIVGFSIMGFLGAILFWLLYRRDPNAVIPAGPHGHGSSSSLSGLSSKGKGRSAFRNPIVYALAAFLGLCNMGGFSSTFFVPSAVTTVFNLGTMDAAYIISTGYTVGIFANLLVGYLMDRFNKWNVMGVLMTVIVVASLSMNSQNLMVFRIATALVISLGLSAANQVYGLAGEVLRGRETGNVMGIVSLGAGIFGYVGPQMLGVLRDWTGGFQAGWYMVATGAAVTIIEILWFKRLSAAANRTPVKAASA